MLNAERSPTFYRFDSIEQFRVWREMDERDEEPVVIYHSHTATEAYPSRTDISYASEPGAHYVLVSTRDPDVDEFRSFRIADGMVTEEEVRSPWRTEPAERNDPRATGWSYQRTATARTGRARADTQERRSWPSRSVSRPSCVPTPVAPSRSRVPVPPSPSSSATLTPGTAGCASAWWTAPGCGASSTSISTMRTYFNGNLPSPTQHWAINGELRFWLGWAQEVAGDKAAAQQSWRQARSELESFLNRTAGKLLASLEISRWTNLGLGDQCRCVGSCGAGDGRDSNSRKTQ